MRESEGERAQSRRRKQLRPRSADGSADHLPRACARKGRERQLCALKAHKAPRIAAPLAEARKEEIGQQRGPGGDPSAHPERNGEDDRAGEGEWTLARPGDGDQACQQCQPGSEEDRAQSGGGEEVVSGKAQRKDEGGQ